MKELKGILTVIAGLLAANLIVLLCKADGTGLPVAMPATAASPVLVTKNGDILTTNQEGSKLYLWYDARTNAPSDQYKAVEFSK